MLLNSRVSGFAPKVPWCGFDFAAGVGFAAVAMPRGRGAFYIFELCPWCGLWLNKPEGLSPDQGIARE